MMRAMRMRQASDDEIDEIATYDSTTPITRLHAKTSGFPSPAEDHAEATLDLQTLLVKRPAATFFLEMVGDAMRGAGVFSGDILIVDRSLTPIPGAVVVAVVEGELVARRYEPTRHGVLYLTADHPNVRPIRIAGAMTCEVWGVVIYAIHRLNRPTHASH